VPPPWPPPGQALHLQGLVVSNKQRKEMHLKTNLSRRRMIYATLTYSWRSGSDPSAKPGLDNSPHSRGRILELGSRRVSGPVCGCKGRKDSRSISCTAFPSPPSPPQARRFQQSRCENETNPVSIRPSASENVTTNCQFAMPERIVVNRLQLYFMNADYAPDPGGQTMIRQRRIALFLAAIAVCCVPCSAWAGNVLQNGGFETPTPGLSPPNYPTSITGQFASGPSSAADWTLFNGEDATTSTELLPSTDPTGAGLMIHVTSVPTAPANFTAFNGLQQAFPTQSGAVTVSVDIDVLQGSVFVGLFANDGGTLLMPFKTIGTPDQWQTVTFTMPAGTEPNLIAIYSDNFTAGATDEYYADNAVVSAAQAVPEPSSGVLAVIGMSATALWVRKARRRLGRRRASE
jgi:hypothetical protein